MCTTSTAVLILLIAARAVAPPVGNKKEARDRSEDKCIPSALGHGAPFSLRIHAVKDLISPDAPGRLKVELCNTSKAGVWVDKRLILGHHIDLYVLPEAGPPERLVYPARAIALPDRDDFALIRPGQCVARTVEVYVGMLPEFARRSGEWTFAVKTTIIDSGRKLGLKGWTGKLKEHVRLKVLVR